MVSQSTTSPDGNVHEHTPLIAGRSSAGPSTGAAHGTNPNRSKTIDDLSWVETLALFFALYSGVFLAALDTTVVSTLLSHIASDLRALDNISWVATAYLIAHSAFQPLSGKLSDIYGRKAVLLVSMLFFAAGCQLCGASASLWPLVAGRFVSGLGAGGMLSMSTITVSDYVPLRRRGLFQGLGNLVFGTGASIGGVLGGWATDLRGWRFAFSIQVPIALACAILMALTVENKKAEVVNPSLEHQATDPLLRSSFSRIDFVGSFSLAGSVVLFMFAVTTGGQQFAWSSVEVVGCFAASAALAILFWFWEAHHAVEPVLPLDMLARRGVATACLVHLFVAALSYGFLFYSPIMLTAMFEYPYSVLGHRMIMNFLGVAMGSLGVGLIIRLTGRYYRLSLISAAAIVISQFMFLVLPFIPVELSGSPLYQSFGYWLNGLSQASVATVSLVSLIASVPPAQQAMATSAQYTFRGAGSSIGVAIAAALFDGTLRKQLVARVHGKHAEKVISKVLKSVEAISDAPAAMQPAIRRSYALAGTAVFAVSLVYGLSALVAAGASDEHTLEVQSEPPANSSE